MNLNFKQSIKKDNRSLWSIVIFFIWPLGAVFYAFYNYRRKWSKNIVWLYLIYFGYTFKIPPKSTIDANRYWDYLEKLHYSSITFGDVISTLYSTGPNSHVDIFQPIITWVVAQFTADYHVLFAVVGLVFGYFFSRNIWYVLDRNNKNISWITFSIVAILFFVIPPWSINKFRFTTAALIFLYGALYYFDTNEKKYLLVSLCSCLVHFAFILPILLLFIYKLIGNNFRIYYWLFIITIPLSLFSLESARNVLLNITPAFIHSKVKAYTSFAMYHKYVIHEEQAQSIFSTVYSYFPLIITFSGFSFIYLNMRKFKLIFSSNSKKLLGFLAIIMITLNVIGFIPAMSRFQGIMLFLFMVFLFIAYIYYPIKGLKKFLAIMSPIYLLYAIGMIRVAIGLRILSFNQLLGGPIYLIIKSAM